MAYEVTATRRRPQKFEDVVGQEFVVATLKNAIQSGKIAHAYLFAGPRGCGKTTSARILAKALNCEHGPTATPCCTCSTCTEIAKGTSMDVIEIDGASNTSVNDIRQIKDEVLFPPNTCRYKVYIIDEVHMLSNSAFNALLKTIEEPPPYVIFIFATTELHKVPATIKSRCQQFNVRLVPIEKIKDLLAEAAAELNIEADEEALYWIAKESTGSVRDAYTLFDQVASFSEGHITYEKIRDKLGLVGIERLNELCEFCISNDTSGAINKIDELLQSGVSIEQLISNFADYIRSMLLLKTGITKEALLGQSPERFSQNVLNAWSSVQLERALSLFLQLYRDIRYSIEPRFELELTISRLCWLSSYVSSAEIKQAVDQARYLLIGAPADAGTIIQNQMKPKGNQFDRTSFDNIEKPIEYIRKKIESNPVIQQRMPKPVQNEIQPQEENIPKVKISSSANNVIRQKIEQAQEMKAKTEEAEIKKTEPVIKEEKQASLPEENKEQKSLSMEELKNISIETFSKKNPLLGSALMQSGEWFFEKNKIVTHIRTPYLKNQILKEKAYICSVLSQMLGEEVSFEAELLQEKKPSENEPVNLQVALLCKVFKGTEIKDV